MSFETPEISGPARDRRARRSYRLPAGLEAELEKHCWIAKERAADVVADAVALHLDELNGRIEEDREVAGAGGV